jgi:hypothetical protein
VWRNGDKDWCSVPWKQWSSLYHIEILRIVLVLIRVYWRCGVVAVCFWCVARGSPFCLRLAGRLLVRFYFLWFESAVLPFCWLLACGGCFVFYRVLMLFIRMIFLILFVTFTTRALIPLRTPFKNQICPTKWMMHELQEWT